MLAYPTYLCKLSPIFQRAQDYCKVCCNFGKCMSSLNGIHFCKTTIKGPKKHQVKAPPSHGARNCKMIFRHKQATFVNAGSRLQQRWNKKTCLIRSHTGHVIHLPVIGQEKCSSCLPVVFCHLSHHKPLLPENHKLLR